LHFRHLNVKPCCNVPKTEDVDLEVNVIFYLFQYVYVLYGIVITARRIASINGVSNAE